jgi:hypothetical protein
MKKSSEAHQFVWDAHHHQTTWSHFVDLRQPRHRKPGVGDGSLWLYSHPSLLTKDTNYVSYVIKEPLKRLRLYGSLCTQHSNIKACGKEAQVSKESDGAPSLIDPSAVISMMFKSQKTENNNS